MAWPVAVALAGCGGTAERNADSGSDGPSDNGSSGGSGGRSAVGGAASGGNAGFASSDPRGGGGSTSVGGGGGTGGSGGANSVMGGGGSGGDESAPSTFSIFVDEDRDALANETFFDHPWPSDMRLQSDGVRLTGFPNPRGVALLESYLEIMAGRLDGFSPVATGYLRFTDALDPDTLPGDVLQSVDADSSVRLIDVEPGSPSFGDSHPLSISFRDAPGVYLPENVLAFHPAFGQPLRPATRYALVVTDAVRDARGGPVGPDDELSLVLADEHDSASYDEALIQLDELGVARDEIVHLAVFTTSDPTREAYAVRDWVIDNYPAPTTLDAWSAEEQEAGYDVYEGRYGDTPDFQAGAPPFVAEGGEFTFDGNGDPILARETDLRFALGVPDEQDCPEPESGYPVVLVAHGTGGDYRSAFVAADPNNGVKGTEVTMFSAVCLATLSIDQIFHGERPGNGAPDQLYFNLQNPLAARTNGAQSALDFVQLARLVSEGNLVVPASVSRTGEDISFDPDKVLFFGHSQGGLNGPIALAMDDLMRGGVMSGAGATVVIALLQKTAPLDISALVPILLQLDAGEAGEVDEFHPALSLVQMIADPSDGINYARAIISEPRAGFDAKSLLMTEGVRADGTGDSYAPPRGIESLAVAMGLPPAAPTIFAPPYAEWAGLDSVGVPQAGLAGNLAGGSASGVLSQFDADLASDGHFVAYQADAARQQVAGFLRNLADEPSGRVPAP